MRIKFLSVIAGFLCLSFMLSSCLGNDNEEIQAGSNALVQAFQLDKVLGVNYKFSIDQLAGRIYNQDSLPVGSDTIIDKILITGLPVAGFVTIRNKANTEDSIVDMKKDSVNLVGTMAKPFKFKVWAPDMKTTKEYLLEVRVHQQHPDSLRWGETPVATNYAPGIGRQKAVLFKDNIYVYTGNSPAKAYTASTVGGTAWKEVAVNLPNDFNLYSLVRFKGRLFVATQSGNVYYSDDALTWQKHETLSTGKVKTLIAAFDLAVGENPLKKTIGIAGITQEAEGLHFNITDPTATNWGSVGEKVPENFPLNHTSSFVYLNKNGVRNAIAVGNLIAPTAADTSTVVWATTDGKSWVALITESSLDCPVLAEPSIIHYDGAFYVLDKKFDGFYKSMTGLEWKQVKAKFMLPKSVRGVESDYSVIVDGQNFIWLMRATPNEVWRGRLNRLGFLIQ